jgi:hypothetical protein
VGVYDYPLRAGCLQDLGGDFVKQLYTAGELAAASAAAGPVQVPCSAARPLDGRGNVSWHFTVVTEGSKQCKAASLLSCKSVPSLSLMSLLASSIARF